jgi:spore coat protein JB
MDLKREEMLREVMAADFTVFDLALYLNTHPYDTKALSLYRASVQRAGILSTNYQRLYGPLTIREGAYGSSNSWQWIKSPWPWES